MPDITAAIEPPKTITATLTPQEPITATLGAQGVTVVNGVTSYPELDNLPSIGGKKLIGDRQTLSNMDIKELINGI